MMWFFQGLVFPNSWKPMLKKKTFVTKSFSERKGSLSHMLARKGSWDTQDKPPAAGLDGTYKHVCCPGADGALLKM